MMRRAVVPALLMLSMATAVAVADEATPSPLGSPFGASAGGYTPSVPVSPLGRPSAWLDPAKLHFTSETRFGTGFNGQSAGLQVFRVGYQLAPPLAVQMSVGNAFGANGSSSLQNGHFFLEGLDVAYRPFRSMLINVQYRDVRSPLQLQNPYGYYGSAPFGR